MLLFGARYIAVEAVSAVRYILLGGRIEDTRLSRPVQRRLDDIVTGVSFVGLAGDGPSRTAPDHRSDNRLLGRRPIG